MSLDIQPIVGTSEEDRSWSWQWINQWPGVLMPRRHNWVDFTFIEFQYEWDRMMGNAHEIRFILLGLGFRWSANFRRSHLLNRMIAEVDQIKASIRDEDGEDPPHEAV